MNMVRRRGMGCGLANQLTYSAYQHLLPQQQHLSQLDVGWLGGTPNQFMSTMSNQMAGALPRMPKLQQPEPSSRKLSRLRRNLMNITPQLISPSTPQMQSAYREPPSVVPMWSRSSGHMSQDSAWTRSVMSDYASQQREAISDLSLQLKQQLRQLKHQQQQQQLQQQQQQQLQLQQQQLQQQHRQLKSSFVPFNFGKCASNLINFLESSASICSMQATTTKPKDVAAGLQPVPTISIVKRAQPVQRRIHGADFQYVKLAKRMVATAKAKQVDPKMLANKRGAAKAPVSLKAVYTDSSTTLINHSEAQAGSKIEKPNENPALRQLDSLAGDIEANLKHIRQLLVAELPQSVQDVPKIRENLATLHQSEFELSELNPMQSGNSTRHASLATLQQSDWELLQQQSMQSGNSARYASTTTLHQAVGQHQGTTIKCASLAALQQRSPTKPTNLATLQPETNNPIDQQELNLTTHQLELLQKMLEEKDLAQMETKTELERIKTTSKRGSHRRHINLNKLFKNNGIMCEDSSNPLWSSLMQMVGHICDDDGKPLRKAERLGAGGSGKHYSVYLTVTSDEEEDDNMEGKKCIVRKKLAVNTRRKQSRLRRMIRTNRIEIPAPCSTLHERRHAVPRKPLITMKRVSLISRGEDVISCITLPTRRPLHWPHPRRMSDPALLRTHKTKKKKLLRRVCRRSALDNNLILRYPLRLHNPKRGYHHIANPFLPQPPLTGNFTQLWSC